MRYYNANMRFEAMQISLCNQTSCDAAKQQLFAVRYKYWYGTVLVSLAKFLDARHMFVCPAINSQSCVSVLGTLDI